MPAEITMPQLSDTMTEGTVIKWHKREGDKVRAGEEIADVETDKAVMPMEAFESGTLAVIKVKEGEKIVVGGVLAVIATGSEKVDDVKKTYAAGGGGSSSAAAPPKPAPAAQPTPTAPSKYCPFLAGEPPSKLLAMTSNIELTSGLSKTTAS